ncbi:uncharacterized protein K444DRAFT_354033 [Hyaloscypha bicolor E]|uniref:Uncharacterized protein n=1 Tax=Hyaloscypha bicolor E TaxID=1095630 RepID=A0A2J6TIT4_9HELO|nr:uncharacterized protein K444DRAFT_354033 [Hyaloscypha bicolor E]PMD62915.1 hypothetical protein K444DRAFT_354033 [Hyaloscypha bicolor E]
MHFDCLNNYPVEQRRELVLGHNFLIPFFGGVFLGVFFGRFECDRRVQRNRVSAIPLSFSQLRCQPPIKIWQYPLQSHSPNLLPAFSFTSMLLRET